MTRAPAAENSRLREQPSSDLPFQARIAAIPPQSPESSGTSNFKQVKAGASDHVAGAGDLPASRNAVTTYSPGFGTGNVINLPALEHGGFSAAGTPSGAYAYAPESAATRNGRNVRAQALSPNDPYTVYEGGQYVGRDPDPNVRLQLRRDWTHD